MADFSLLRTSNFMQGVLSGYEAGAKIGQRRRVQAALSNYRNDPQGAIDETLAAGDIDTSNALQARYKSQRVQSALGNLYGGSGVLAPSNAGALSPAGSTGADPHGKSPLDGPYVKSSGTLADRISAGEAPADDEIVVTGRQPAPKAPPFEFGNLNPVAVLELMQHDPATAISLIRMSSRESAAASKRVDVALERQGRVIAAIRSYPADQRDDIYQGFKRQLEEEGVTGLPDEWDEEYADAQQRIGLTLQQIFQNDRADQRLDADIADDEADNARADRNTASIIADRDGRRSLIARGQDIASRDRRRGQDISATRPKGGKGAGAAPSQQASAPVQVKSKADYDRLKKGDPYIAPDGSTRRKN